jgi:tetratricopeptide (TPR) repeat protein
LGDVYRKLKERDTAFQLYTESLNVLSKALDADNPEIAEVEHCLGLIETDRHNFKEAEKHLNRAIQIIQEKFGAIHVKLGFYMNSLGKCLLDQGHFETATDLFHRSLIIIEQTLGNDDIEVVYLLFSRS